MILTSHEAEASGAIPTEPLARPLTVRDLLEFRAGIGARDDASDLGRIWAERDIYAPGGGTLADRVDRILTAPLYEQPGQQWRYGWTADVIARVVEVAADQPFGDFLEARIFGPLGMSATHWHHSHQHLVPGRAYSYAPAGRGKYEKAVLSYSVVGATSLFTTAQDLELWQAHFVDQEVRTVIEKLFDTGMPDPSLVNLVKKRAKGLTSKDVKASLARVRVDLDFPPEAVVRRSTRPRPAKAVETVPFAIRQL